MAFNLAVLTLNIWGIVHFSEDREIRVNAISKELSVGKYDVVALQEVWSDDDYELIQEAVKNVLPYQHYFYR